MPLSCTSLRCSFFSGSTSAVFSAFFDRPFACAFSPLAVPCSCHLSPALRGKTASSASSSCVGSQVPWLVATSDNPNVAEFVSRQLVSARGLPSAIARSVWLELHTFDGSSCLQQRAVPVSLRASLQQGRGVNSGGHMNNQQYPVGFCWPMSLGNS